MKLETSISFYHTVQSIFSMYWTVWTRLASVTDKFLKVVWNEEVTTCIPPFIRPQYQRKVGPFSHTTSQDFLWGSGCIFEFFFPKKLTTFFSRRIRLCLHQTFASTFRRQNSVVTKLAVGRWSLGGTDGGDGAPMVQPAQWLIRLCLLWLDLHIPNSLSYMDAWESTIPLLCFRAKSFSLFLCLIVYVVHHCSDLWIYLYWFYELFETLLIFIVCIMLCSFVLHCVLFNCCMQLPGAIRAFRAWLLLFYSLLQMFLLWCYVFKQINLMMMIRIRLRNKTHARTYKQIQKKNKQQDLFYSKSDHSRTGCTDAVFMLVWPWPWPNDLHIRT